MRSMGHVLKRWSGITTDEKIRKMIAVLLLLLIAVSFSGCSEDRKDSTGDSEAEITDYADTEDNDSSDEPEAYDTEDDGLDWTGFPEERYDSGLYDDDLDRTVAGTWSIPRGYGFIFTLDYPHKGHFKYVDMDMPETEFEGDLTWSIRNGYVAIRSDNIRVDMTVFEYDKDNDLMYLYGDPRDSQHAYRRQ